MKASLIRAWNIMVLMAATSSLAAETGTGQPDRAARPETTPAESRILKIIHGWPEASPAQDQLIQQLQRQGFGGVVCNVAFRDYLESEAQWKAFERAVKAARSAGMSLWLYDEKGYPSGNAGGLVMRDHPEWEAQGLLIVDQEVEGKKVTLKQPPGILYLAAAFPVANGWLELDKRQDLTSQLRAGKLEWDPPQGRWHVMLITISPLFEGTHAELNLHEKLPYPNLLLAEPTKRFLELTHRRYASHLGGNLGQWFAATFTDEPSLMSMFLRPMPYRTLPWSPTLPADFKKRHGFDLEPWVPALVAEAEGGPKARYAYWETIGALVAERFFVHIQNCCRELGIPSGGHLLAEEGLAGHVPLYGNFFECIRRLDAPSIDCLTSLPADVPGYLARLISSAAELDGRPLTMCETSDHSQRYRPAGDRRPVREVTEAEIRGTCNRLIVSGIDTITSYYSFAGLSDEQIRRLNEWVGRCCAFLKGGNQVADLAVVYPIESTWPRFVPAAQWANGSAPVMKIEGLYRSSAEALFQAGRDFTFIDAQAVRQAVARGEQLLHGPLRWRAVILPGADTLPLAAWEKLAEFVRQGGILIALGNLPCNSESAFPDRRVEALSRELFDTGREANPAASAKPRITRSRGGGAGIFLPTGTESLLTGVLDRLLTPELKTRSPKAPLRITHRRMADADHYFIINDSDLPWHGAIGLPAKGTGELIDPASGRTETVANPAEIPLQLAAYGGVLLHFAQTALPEKRGIPTELLPEARWITPSQSAPRLSRGEFVKEELQPDATCSQPEHPAWRIQGSLTKSQVDTFLFASFACPDGLPAGAVDTLVLDAWIPARQTTPNQLLVILHERGGADYLAESGLMLGVGGPQRAYLPFTRFHLAGWSKDDNGHLDTPNISEIRIGWGGYLGTAGERVEFSTTLPQFFKMTLPPE